MCPKGAFNNYVDQFWPNFDPSPLEWTSVDILRTLIPWDGDKWVSSGWEGWKIHQGALRLVQTAWAADFLKILSTKSDC